MKKKVLLFGLIVLGIYCASRMLRTPEGADESGASKAASAIRERAPGVVEYVGRATEKGAQTIREMTNGEHASEGDGQSDIESSEKDAATSETAS